MTDHPSKLAIENAVNRAANSVHGIVRVFEEHGAHLTEASLDKVFAHLRLTLKATEYHASAARILSMTKAFSLDDNVPLANVPSALELERALSAHTPVMTFVNDTKPVLATVDNPPALTEIKAPEKPKWVKPEGRLAGTKEPIYPTNGAARPAASRELDAAPDVTGFVKTAGFIDK